MSRRFGRNQRRKMREQLTELQQRYDALVSSLYHEPLSNTIRVDRRRISKAFALGVRL